MIEKIKQFIHNIKAENTENSPEPRTAENQINELFDNLNTDIIRIQLGYDLAEHGEELLSYISDLRYKIKNKNGFILPKVHVISSEDLQENEYQIDIREKQVFNDFLIPTQEQIIEKIPTALENICRQYIENIFTNEIMEKYISSSWSKNSWMMEQIVHHIPMSSLRIILTELLKNDKSIKDIAYIFEKILEFSKIEEFPCHIKDPYLIAQKLCSVV